MDKAYFGGRVLTPLRSSLSVYLAAFLGFARLRPIRTGVWWLYRETQPEPYGGPYEPAHCHVLRYRRLLQAVRAALHAASAPERPAPAYPPDGAGAQGNHDDHCLFPQQPLPRLQTLLHRVCRHTPAPVLPDLAQLQSFRRVDTPESREMLG